MRNSLFAFSILTAILVGCMSQSIPEVTPELAESMGADEAEMRQGRALYLQHCNQCHDRVTPGKLDAEYWREIIPHMAKNAQLKEGEGDKILLYLMAAHGEVHHLEDEL